MAASGASSTDRAQAAAELRPIWLYPALDLTRINCLRLASGVDGRGLGQVIASCGKGLLDLLLRPGLGRYDRHHRQVRHGILAFAARHLVMAGPAYSWSGKEKLR